MHNSGFCKGIISLIKYILKIAIKSCMFSVLYEMKDNKMLTKNVLVMLYFSKGWRTNPNPIKAEATS